MRLDALAWFIDMTSRQSMNVITFLLIMYCMPMMSYSSNANCSVNLAMTDFVSAAVIKEGDMWCRDVAKSWQTAYFTG